MSLILYVVGICGGFACLYGEYVGFVLYFAN
ncbi:MAG: hypothetical protein JWM46_492 [Candidatus Kaiserbacteria bacterium]|nr:hypothetical protein [Candidatus Kaiserbacteria bacterium]